MSAASRSALAVALLLGGAAGADARTEVRPYLEVQQVFDAELSGNHDTAAFTGVGAGIDITVDQSKLRGQLDYRYDHFFSWSNRYRGGDTHNGLASGVYSLAPGVSLQAAGIATRTRGSLTAASPGLYVGDFNNTQQVYAVSAGPSVARQVGPFSVNADYRFGWTKVDNGTGSYDLGPGQPVLDSGFSTTSHTVDGSIGIPAREGILPVGVSVTGGYVRDNVDFLDAHYDGAFVQGNVVVPITPTFAAVGGAGYEWNQASVAQIRTDANGNAILSDNRRLEADRSKPRVLVYDEDGLIWDVGVLWRPSERLNLDARVVRRYGSTGFVGSLRWQPGHTQSVQVVAYNDVTSFGRQLSGEAGTLPTSFMSPDSSIPIGLTGCVFGTGGGGGTCLPGLSSVNSNFYRSRGVYALYSITRGPWSFGIGADYDHRRYLAGNYDSAGVVGYDRVHDDVVTVNGVASRRLNERSSISGNLYVAWYDTSLLNSRGYTSYGGTAAYTRLFTRRLVGQAAISVFSGTGDGYDDDVVGAALLALRYQL